MPLAATPAGLRFELAFCCEESLKALVCFSPSSQNRLFHLSKWFFSAAYALSLGS